MNNEQLIIFVKAPRPGEVKTRLARAIGLEEACVAYRHLVETLLTRIEPLPGVELRFTPDDARAEIAPWLRSLWRCSPQGDGDLGQRLLGAFASAFSAGAQRVVVIGSDCPEVTVEDVREAWRALESHEVVIGPATDGGYWLIGLREARVELFENIPWSTDRVLRETERAADAFGWRVHRLRELSDIDTEDDWRRYREQS